MRREVDQHDARRVRLYPTEKAEENLQRLREVWSRLLEETVADPNEIDAVISTLRHIETRLVARSASTGGRLATRAGTRHSGCTRFSLEVVARASSSVSDHTTGSDQLPASADLRPYQRLCPRFDSPTVLVEIRHDASNDHFQELGVDSFS